VTCAPPAQELADRLRSAGYKLTPARLAVLQVVEGEHLHLNTQEIMDRAAQICPGLGRATVYRTLELLTELGILRPIYLDESSPHFIRAEGGHHHLVCSDCGEIVEFDDCVASELTHALEEKFGFTIESHLLEFIGRCPRCQE
jgi:Fur family ferric uptake transcriptional regulator